MVKYLVMDVDGTLTDGKIYMSKNGELMKAFSIKDGCGINMILKEKGILPIIITTRYSEILEKRCEELNVEYLFQDVHDKEEKLKELLVAFSAEPSKFAYIGDDLNDLPCMIFLKNYGGVIGCPNDAVDSVKNISDYICMAKGGDGAVREYIEWLVNFRN